MSVAIETILRLLWGDCENLKEHSLISLCWATCKRGIWTEYYFDNSCKGHSRVKDVHVNAIIDLRLGYSAEDVQAVLPEWCGKPSATIRR